MSRQVAVTLALATALLAGQLARAEAAPSKVVVAPLGSLGAQHNSRQLQATELLISTSLGAVPSTTVVFGKQVRTAVRAAKRPQLLVCDGEADCLTELGQLLTADYVVYGEVGDLGEAQVVFLRLVDVNTGRELRTTTLELGQPSVDPAHAARSAAFRLLAPDDYVGSLMLTIDVAGATVYLDGQRVASDAPIRTTVGNHALRVTHSEYRDFVRFVEVGFGEQTVVIAALKAFPIVESQMTEQPRAVPLVPQPTDQRRQHQAAAWYQRWYTVAGAGVVLFVGSALVAGYLADGIDVDQRTTVGE